MYSCTHKCRKCLQTWQICYTENWTRWMRYSTLGPAQCLGLLWRNACTLTECWLWLLKRPITSTHADLSELERQYIFVFQGGLFPLPVSISLNCALDSRRLLHSYDSLVSTRHFAWSCEYQEFSIVKFIFRLNINISPQI